MTKVKFYKELGGILAVFPEDNKNGNGYRKDLISCYSHVGQHSVCAPEYLKPLRKAKYEEYKDLLTELKSFDVYKELKVINN